MTTTDKIKTKIIYLLETNNISQRELARRADIPIQTLNSILTNKVKSPTVDNIEKIAKAYNMTLIEFLKD